MWEEEHCRFDLQGLLPTLEIYGAKHVLDEAVWALSPSALRAAGAVWGGFALVGCRGRGTHNFLVPYNAQNKP